MWLVEIISSCHVALSIQKIIRNLFRHTFMHACHHRYEYLNIWFYFRRWQAPISIALHAPGTDFTPTLNSIRYLRDCAPESALVRQFTTFHIYFSSKHIPKSVSWSRVSACIHTHVIKNSNKIWWYIFVHFGFLLFPPWNFRYQNMIKF